MYDNIIEGLKILSKYPGDFAAEHDIIFAGPFDLESISEEDRFKLESLGWFIDSQFDSWAYFV